MGRNNAAIGSFLARFAGRGDSDESCPPGPDMSFSMCARESSGGRLLPATGARGAAWTRVGGGDVEVDEDVDVDDEWGCGRGAEALTIGR